MEYRELTFKFNYFLSIFSKKRIWGNLENMSIGLTENKMKPFFSSVMIVNIRFTHEQKPVYNISGVQGELGNVLRNHT